MSDLATLHHFSFNSDFPADMISYYKRWDFSIPAGGSGTKSYNHNLPYKPLVFGVWADNAAFTNSRPCSDGWFGITLYSDATKIYAYYDFSTKASATNVKMRVYAYAPTTHTSYVQASADSSTPLIFDTDEDYAPLIFEGCFTTKVMSSASDHVSKAYNVKNGYQNHTETCNGVSIIHDLPTRPNVMLWAEDSTGKCAQSGQATYDYYGGWHSQTYPNVSFNSNSVELIVGDVYQQSDVIKAHIRVYA